MTHSNASRKLIRTAARTITTDPSHAVRLQWLRDNAPEVAVDVETRAARLLPVTSAEYPRTAMQLFSRLVTKG